MYSILFETHHLYYLPNFSPIIQELKNRGDYDIVASIPQTMPKKERELFYEACKKLTIKVMMASDEQERTSQIKKKKFDIIIVGNVGQLKQITSEKTLAVMVYHGIGLKQSYYRDMDDRINLRAVESQDRFDELQAAGHQNLVLTGFSKLDPLFHQQESDIPDMHKKLNLDPHKKTILYAPSFYPSSIEKLFPEFEFLSTMYNIIIKLHHFSWHQKRYKYQSQLATDMFERCKNIHLLSGDIFDVTPYFQIADILVSDISSTLFEFLPLNKPIIQANCFTLRLKHKIFSGRFWKKLDVDRMQNMDFTYIISTPAELASRIQFALDIPDEMSLQRQEAHDQFLYKTDGKASKRLVDAIEEKLK